MPEAGLSCQKLLAEGLTNCKRTTNLADLPVSLGALRVSVVAVDTILPEDPGGRVAHVGDPLDLLEFEDRGFGVFSQTCKCKTFELVTRSAALPEGERVVTVVPNRDAHRRSGDGLCECRQERSRGRNRIIAAHVVVGCIDYSTEGRDDLGRVQRVDLFEDLRLALQCDDGDTEWNPGESCNATCDLLICGDPDDSGSINASDALYALRTAVSLETCDVCVCSVDGNQNNSATDALAVLRFAVALPVTLSCPPCDP